MITNDIFIFNISVSDNMYNAYYSVDNKYIKKSDTNFINACSQIVTELQKTKVNKDFVDTMSYNEECIKYLTVIVTELDSGLYRASVLSNVNENEVVRRKGSTQLQAIQNLFHSFKSLEDRNLV